jgi:hypothetical protein
MNVNKRIWKREPPVDDDSCKALFCRAVLGADGKSQDNDHLDEVCEEVDLKKCGGVPLAIIAFASLLASKPRDKWYRVCKSINFGPKENPNVENISMSLSYYGLPSRLRSCLMHLSNFKWTNKVSSIWKWVAEGFLGTDEEVEGLFEIGEVYFNILDKTSMIQQADMYEAECYLEGCRMNDMMLHLIRSSSSRQKFVRITDNEHEEVASESNVSRLAIIGGKRGKIDRIRKMVSLKSLCASHYEVDKIIEVWSDFKGLCVLDLIRCTHSRKSNRRLTGIGNLVQLKYLGLEGTPVDELEEEDVENLSCLQTLNLRHTGLEKLPSSIGQLGKLVCLWADDRTTFPAGLLRNLKSLQDLQLRLRSGAAGSLALVLELSKLTELRSLNIGVDDKLEAALAESMGCLEKIRSLVIRSASKSVTTHLADGLPGLGLLRCLSLEGICFSKMPACIISSSSTLRRLAVAVEILEETDAQSLRILPELTCLNLVVAAPYTGSLNNAGALFFRKLKFCTTNVLPAALLPLPAPVLEVLQFAATVQDVLVTGDHPADLGLGLLPSLRNVTVLLNCWGASAEEQQKAEAALRAVANRDGSKIQVIKENQGGKVCTTNPLIIHCIASISYLPGLMYIYTYCSQVLNTLQLPERLRQENPLLGPELAKMRGNQQVSITSSTRILIHTPFSVCLT